MKPTWPSAFLLCICFCLAAVALGQDDVETLLVRLGTQPLDLHSLYALEAHPPDPRIIPALEQTFDSRNDKSEKQEIAVTLLRLGDRPAKLFEFLAGYARIAVEDRTPLFMDFDGNGRAIRGRFSAEFDNWCKLNAQDPKTIAARQIGEYPKDVLFLARSQDPRANAIFREGLESPYPNVVAYSVQGLGRLQDTTALPLVAKACERLRGGQIAVAMELPWYGTREAEALMERLVPDRKGRDFLTRQVQQMRVIELKEALSRASAPNQK